MAPESSERRDTSCAAFAGYVRAMAADLVRRATLPVPGRRSWLTDAQVWLEPDAWERAVALVENASALVHASARPPRADGIVHVNLSAAQFPLTDPPAPEEPR